MDRTRRQAAERWCEAAENINPPDSEEGMVCAELRDLYAIRDQAELCRDLLNSLTGEHVPLAHALVEALDCYDLEQEAWEAVVRP